MATCDQRRGSTGEELDRRDRIQRWVNAAQGKPDPVGWFHAVFDDALEHLNGHPDASVSKEAKRELFAIRSDVLSGLSKRHTGMAD
jgi:hypothetical protein